MENINKKPQRYISKFRRKTGTVFVFVFEIVEPVLFGVAAIFFYYILTSSSSQIFIDSDRDRDHNYSIYTMDMIWGGVSAIEIRH